MAKPTGAILAIAVAAFAGARPINLKQIKEDEAKLPPLPALPDPKGVYAVSAAIRDGRTGKLLWGKESTKSMFPASTTKIMTGLLLVEHCKPGDLISAPPEIKEIGEASLHLQPGEQLDARNMLWGVMLRSANDGCYAVAKHISGSIEAFAKLMNDRAKEIGCVNTHFVNPNGLHDKSHWTCAADLTAMAREALKNPWFAEVVRTRKHQIARSMNTKDTWLISKNRMLLEDPTADGVKTGYTVPAGNTYVGSATRGGERFITCVMKSPHWAVDHKKMMDWAFANFEHVVIAHKGDRVAALPVGSGATGEVEAVLAEDLVDCVPKGEASSLKLTSWPESNVAPIQAGQALGSAVYTDSTGFKVEVEVVAASSVPAASPGSGRTAASVLPLVGGLAGFALLGGAWYRARNRRWGTLGRIGR